MDPWYLNRLNNASASFQSGAGASASEYHPQLAGHQAGNGCPPTPSTPQLLLQAAHSSSLPSSPFNHNGFLASSPYDYAAFFPHTSRTSPYAPNQQRVLGSTLPSTKSSESDPSSVREKYSPAHHASFTSGNNSYFDHQTSTPGAIAWSQESNSLLPSPFGVLPHESVAASPSGSSSVKSGSSVYPFNGYAAPPNLSHYSQIDYKSLGTYSEGKSSSSYPDGRAMSSLSNAKKNCRSQSPSAIAKTAPPSSLSATYYSASAQGNALTNFAATEPDLRSHPSNSIKPRGSALVPMQESCIVQSQSATPSTKNFCLQEPSRESTPSAYDGINSTRSRQAGSTSPNFVPPPSKLAVPQHSVQTKAQTKVHQNILCSESAGRSGSPVIANQPVTGSCVPGHYITGHHDAPVLNKQVLNNDQSHQRNILFPQDPSHQVYGHFANTARASEVDYHHVKSSSVVASYNSSSHQNGSSCSAMSQNRSRTASLSQSSPVDHAHSPTYPIYNSPVASIQSPSSLLPSETNNHCHQRVSGPFKETSQVISSVPVDVPLSGSQGGGSLDVVYPSVITKALSASDSVPKPPVYRDESSYEQNQGGSSFSKQCWDSNHQSSVTVEQVSDSQQKKYLGSSKSTALTADAPNQQQTARTPSYSTETHQSYYNFVTAQQTIIQDLSNTRNDPRSVTKNLPSNGVSMSSPNESESHSRTQGRDDSIPSKRRNQGGPSGVPSSLAVYGCRDPPPAHHNITQYQPSESFLTNLSSRPYGTPQTSYSCNSGVTNLHQGTYNSPFYPQFPLTHSSSSPFVSSPKALPENQNLMTQPHQHFDHSLQVTSPERPQETPSVQEKSSEVLVPALEDELNFLVGPVLMIKTQEHKKRSIASGFQDSYVKFLQGVRETSPIPVHDGARKTRIYLPEPTKLNCSSLNSSSLAFTDKEKKEVYKLDDDPRYFPLPKTDAQRSRFDSSESDSDFGTSNIRNPKTHGSKPRDQKPVAAVAPRTANKPVAVAGQGANHAASKRGRKRRSNALLLPRRESCKRKAKEKGTVMLDDGDDGLPTNAGSIGDSDSDPAWTPVAFKPKAQIIDSSDDESQKKKSLKKESHSSSSGRRRSKIAVTDSEDDYSGGGGRQKKCGPAAGPRTRKQSVKTQNASGSSNPVSVANDRGNNTDDEDVYPFKVGEFVVLKSDLNQKWPPIWRVDGKTLLQKFEPFNKGSKKLYRNISTYSGWSHHNRHIYQPVSVKFHLKEKTETIIEFLRDGVILEYDDALLEALVKDTAKFQENFEVYIQTLISQALDSNFLTEIFQEKDEYFLNNVKIIDNVVEDRRKRFLLLANWRTELEASIATWPCYNVIFELVDDEFTKNCAACDKPRVAARVLLYGQPYNSTTLEGCQFDPKLESEKDFFTCRPCLSRIELYNKIVHQKYLMFIECAKRVNERKLLDPSKDTTVILNDLLADETWLNQLFRVVRISWAEIDILEQTAQKK